MGKNIFLAALPPLLEFGMGLVRKMYPLQNTRVQWSITFDRGVSMQIIRASMKAVKWFVSFLIDGALWSIDTTDIKIALVILSSNFVSSQDHTFRDQFYSMYRRDVR